MRGDPVGLPGLAALTLGFLAFLAAMFVARARAGREEAGNATRSRRSQVGVVVQGLGIALAGFGPQAVTLDPLGTAALVEAGVVALLMAATVALFVWSSRTMGRNWSIVARTRADHALVTGGPFAHVRHPIYTALFLLMLAMAIALGHVRHLVVAIPLFALGTWLRTGEEERLLRGLFGARYDAWAARTPRFVPGLF